MKIKLHTDFLKTCIEEDIIPKGLTIDKLSMTGGDSENPLDKIERCFKRMLTEACGMPRGTLYK